MNHTLKTVILMGIMVNLLSCSKDYDYITVTCNVKVQTMENVSTAVPGVKVYVLVQKAGGEKVEEQLTTSTQGETSVTAVFNLFREQPIVAAASLDKLYYVSETLTYEEIQYSPQVRDVEGPKYYTWQPTLVLFVIP